MIIPLDVPQSKREKFQENYHAITKGTDKLFLFAGDQKIEHLNPVPADDLFAIASSPAIGAFATQPGLIARYAAQYETGINYIAKLNAKTNLIPSSQQDPISRELWEVEDVIELQKNSAIAIRGVGYTIYLGSEYEPMMLHQAAEIIREAHEEGLVAILWMYPRGKAVTKQQDVELIAGAAGIANCLGSDFVKIKAPTNGNAAELLQRVVRSAGNTQVICSGGEKQDSTTFLTQLHEQLTRGGAAGAAVGRNIYQGSFEHAQAMAQAISALVYQDCSLEHALSFFEK